MQSKTLIGNQWQLDQGTKAVHVSQSATIQQNREISTGQKLQALFLAHMYIHTHNIHPRMHACTQIHTVMKVNSHLNRKSTRAQIAVSWSADGHVTLTCSQTVIYQEARNTNDTPPPSFQKRITEHKWERWTKCWRGESGKKRWVGLEGRGRVMGAKEGRRLWTDRLIY